MTEKNKGGRPLTTEKKSNAGAPTKYKEEYCQGIIDYFTVQPQQVVYKKSYFADGTLKSEEPVTLPAQLPTFQGYADTIGVHIDTLNEWCKIHEEFSESYARAKQLQEKIWLVNGMSNLYNSQFAQFFGKNCLGYKDKTEVESTNHNLNESLDDLTPEERQKRIAELLNK
jgi:hypothetical protein